MGKNFQIAFEINGAMSSSFRAATEQSKLQMMQLKDTAVFVNAEQRRLNKVFDAGGMSGSQYAETMRNLKKEMRSLQGEMDATRLHQQSLSTEMAKSQQIAAMETAKKQQSAAAALAEQKSVIAAQQQASAAALADRKSVMAAQQQASATGISRSQQIMMQLNDTTKYVAAEQKRLNTVFDSGGMSITQYAATMRNLRAEMDATRSKQTTLSAAMSAKQTAKTNLSAASMGVASTAMTTVVAAAPLIGIIETAAKFEATMSKVKAITGATGGEFQALTAKARDLGETTQFSATQCADAMTFLGTAGWNAEQILSGMPGLLNLAATEGLDLGQTASIVADNLAAFGLSAADASHMADVFALTSTKTNTGVAMLGETMKYAAPVAHAFGASLEETSALAGLMANQGIKASNAGTALRSGFLRLAGPPKMAQKAMDALGMSMNDITAEQKEAAMAMESLGISMQDTDGPKKMSAILTELRDKTAGLGNEEKLATLKAVFGTEAATGWLAVLNSTPGAFEELVNSLENSDGAAEDMAKTMNDNAKGAMLKLKSSVESVAISIGNIFLPMVANAGRTMAEWASGISRVATAYPGVVQGIIGAGAALAGLVMYYKITMAASAAYNAVKATTILLYKRESIAMATAKAATTTWSAATGIMTAAQWAFNAAMTANPLGVIIMGIAALIAIGYVLYKNWDTITTFFGSAWDVTCTTISSAWDATTAYVSSAWAGVTTFLSTAWDSVCAGVSSAWAGTLSLLSDGWDLLKTGIAAYINLWLNLPQTILYAVGYMAGVISTLPAKIGTAIITAGTWLMELSGICMAAGEAFIATAESWLSAAYTSTTTWVITTVTETGDLLMMLPGFCIAAGTAFIAAAIAWLSVAYTSVTGWIMATVSDAEVWLMNLPSICEEAGAAFVLSAENWGSNAYNAVINWISQIPSAISSYISNAWENATASISAGFAAGSGQEVAHNANGGIYNKGAFLTTFAENSAEAAIPLDGSPRAIGLWQRAGQILGFSKRETTTQSSTGSNEVGASNDGIANIFHNTEEKNNIKEDRSYYATTENLTTNANYDNSKSQTSNDLYDNSHSQTDDNNSQIANDFSKNEYHAETMQPDVPMTPDGEHESIVSNTITKTEQNKSPIESNDSKNDSQQTSPISFGPIKIEINVTGNEIPEKIKKAVIEGCQQAQQSFEKKMQEYDRQRGRVSFE